MHVNKQSLISKSGEIHSNAKWMSFSIFTKNLLNLISKKGKNAMTSLMANIGNNNSVDLEPI